MATPIFCPAISTWRGRSETPVLFLKQAQISEDLAEGLDSLMTILPEEDSHKSVEPFCLNLSAIDKLTEEPAKRAAAYLVDMARVEALDTIGEKRKVVELLERHVRDSLPEWLGIILILSNESA